MARLAAEKGGTMTETVTARSFTSESMADAYRATARLRRGDKPESRPVGCGLSV